MAGSNTQALACEAGEQCKRLVAAYDHDTNTALCAHHARARGVPLLSVAPRTATARQRAAHRRPILDRLAALQAAARQGGDDGRRRVVTPLTTVVNSAKRPTATCRDCGAPTTVSVQMQGVARCVACASVKPPPRSPAPHRPPVPRRSAAPTQAAPVAVAPEAPMAPPVCPVHADRSVVRYGLCSACLSNLTATTQRFLASGALPSSTTNAAQAVQRIDLDAAERANWNWTPGARKLRAALQARDAQVATVATCQGQAAPPEEEVPAPAPSPTSTDAAPTAAAPATTSAPAPEPPEEDAVLLSALEARGFVEEELAALSPLARAEQIAARQAALQAELYDLEAEKIVAESEAILAAELPEDPGALLPALPADARAALLSCIDRELWGRHVRTLHSIARGALADHADAQAEATTPSNCGAASAAAK